jgi:hypothetical protein
MSGFGSRSGDKRDEVRGGRGLVGLSNVDLGSQSVFGSEAHNSKLPFAARNREAI